MKGRRVVWRGRRVIWRGRRVVWRGRRVIWRGRRLIRVRVGRKRMCKERETWGNLYIIDITECFGLWSILYYLNYFVT